MKILIILGHYLPGYKAGGPIRTVANLVEWLGHDFQIAIITSDRDFGDTQPYPDVKPGDWHLVGKARVLYLPPESFHLFAWGKVLESLNYDLLYLNSFLSPLTVKTLALRRIGKISKKPVVLAPRGEFSPGALSLKRFKKQLYIKLAKITGLYEDIVWQVSSQYEMEKLLSIFGRTIKGNTSFAYVAPNLPPRIPHKTIVQRPLKQEGAAKIVFLSRIVRMKGLDLALRLLDSLSGRVEFDIYGPKEDPSYWQECQTMINRLPENIQVRYRGEITPDQVVAVFSQYHLLLLPTLGENFGHVILEALCGGCLVLISDQTPWRNLTTEKVGWDLPLSSPGEFGAALKELVSMSEKDFRERSILAQAYGKRFSENLAPVEANRQLFLKALASSS